eukprot:gene36-508_t
MISGIYMLASLCVALGIVTLTLFNGFLWTDSFKAQSQRTLFDTSATAPFSWFFGSSPWFFIVVIAGNFCGIMVFCAGLWLAFSPDLDHLRNSQVEKKKSAWAIFQSGANNTKALMECMEAHYPPNLLNSASMVQFRVDSGECVPDKCGLRIGFRICTNAAPRNL